MPLAETDNVGAMKFFGKYPGRGGGIQNILQRPQISNRI